MSLTGFRKLVSKFSLSLLCLFLLTHCSGQDKPFSLVSGSDSPPPGGNTPGGSGGSTPAPSDNGCFVTFNGTMQLKVSASPAGGAPLEKLDAHKVTLKPIPIKADGNNLTMIGDKFPAIILTTVSDQVDLRIQGTPGATATGTYDPATGKISIQGFKFNLDILTKGTTTPFIDGVETIDGINFTTDSVTATGNLHPITEVGKPVSATDKSVTMVVGLTLPDHFTKLSILDTKIGGGALTATFEGTLDQLPDKCTGTGGTPTNTPGPSGDGGGPTDFNISDGSSPNIGTLDFGTTPVVVTSNNGKTILDCKDALNRGILTKTLTITNVGTTDRKFSMIHAQDTDSDKNDPLCSGSAEFVRGSISISGGATCQTVSVGGKNFAVDQCVLPAASKDAKISFPIMYAPFNFIAPPTGQAVAPDTGTLLFQYDDTKSFELNLIGRTEPDSRDSFSLAKVKDDTVSPKLIKNKGLIKIPLQTGDPKPFTQKLALLNAGTDAWESVTVSTLNTTNPVFSVAPLSATTLAAGDGTNPGKLEFDLAFNPGSDSSYSDTLNITMVKTGSKTADNPQGTVTTLTYTLSGTVGIPTLTGDVQFQVDFLAAKIDHSITVDPVESLDFRAHPEQAPPPLKLKFEDTAADEIKHVTLDVENKDVLTLSLSQREKSLRILNAQATTGKSGTKLVPGQGSDLCNEPPNINIAYDDARQECAYFYFNIFGDTPGQYDDDSGDLTIPEITLRIQNPYHSDIVGKWPKSNPSGNPTYILDTNLSTSLTSLTLDTQDVEENGEKLDLVPDNRISEGDLNLTGKKMGKDCVDDYLNHNPSSGNLADKHPHIKCYLSTGDRYMQGLGVSLRPNSTTEYDVILVGVARFQPGGPNTSNPNLPWFMGDDGGSKIYIAIQGRLYK